jgi:phosphoribosyl 1,2-cyclic phosphodiesterase
MMRVTLWGTRGSIPSPDPANSHYGGNTPCVEVRADDGTVLVLDAGTGIRQLGNALTPRPKRIDILLTHLHMDHIQGLGFFAPLFDSSVEVHIWGPPSTTHDLRACLTRYLSPPLFPVLLRDLPCKLELHEVPCTPSTVGPFRISSTLVCHPGPTVAYRIEHGGSSMAYFPDHEPALGVPDFPLQGEWTSGYGIAADVDLLIHDAQYRADEYGSHVGWGHSSINQMLAFATLARVKQAVAFHHDPLRTDTEVEAMLAAACESMQPTFPVTAAAETAVYELP